MNDLYQMMKIEHEYLDMKKGCGGKKRKKDTLKVQGLKVNRNEVILCG